MQITTQAHEPTAPSHAAPQETPTIQADTDWIADLIEQYPHNEKMVELGTRFGRVIAHLMATEAIAAREPTGPRVLHQHQHGPTYQDRRNVSAPTVNQHSEHYAPGAVQHATVEVLPPQNRILRLSKHLLMNPLAIAAFRPDDLTVFLLGGNSMKLTELERNRLQTFLQND